MKFFILLVIVVTGITCIEFTDEENSRWNDFKLEHGKLFLSPGKEEIRKVTFLKNAKAIDEHNEGYVNGDQTYEKAINKYSDLTDDVFIQRFGGISMPADARTIDPSKVATLRGYYPDSLNLTKTAGVGPIRNQGQCGSCWTFSTAAAVEYAYWVKTNYAGDLSEQNLVDCVYGTRGGCSGGWMPTAMDWISKNGGIAWEYQYKYTAISGSCMTSSIPSKSVWLKKDTSYVQVGSDDASIKSALYNNGVLSICVDASDWSSYKKGIFQSSRFANPQCTHAVALVGYGTEGGIPYWIIRNSWDTWWGELGYMRLDARRSTNNRPLGGIMLDYAYYPLIY